MKPFITYITLLLLASACVEPIEEQLVEPDEEMLVVMNEVGKAVAVETDGILSSFFDANRAFTQNGFVQGPPQKVANPNQQQMPNLGRGDETNYSVSVNRTNGVHTIEFDRNFSRPTISKTVRSLYKYLYLRPNGDFIIYPRLHPNTPLESIRFAGVKAGVLNKRFSQTQFTYRDSISVRGLSRQSGAILFNGKSYSAGSFNAVRGNNDYERTFESTFNYNDLQIKRSKKDSTNFHTEYTGFIDFKFMTVTSVNGEEVEREFEGKIEFTRGPEAFIRLKGARKPFLFSLINGEVFPPPEGGRDD